MTIAVWILSVLLIAEFVMAPINLWTGRTMPTFTRFTGYAPQVATQVFAPAKLASAAMLGIGLAVPPPIPTLRGDRDERADPALPHQDPASRRR